MKVTHTRVYGCSVTCALTSGVVATSTAVSISTYTKSKSGNASSPVLVPHWVTVPAVSADADLCFARSVRSSLVDSLFYAVLPQVP